MKLADMIRPRPGMIAVMVDTREEITPQGLWIPPDSARSLHETRPTHGKVVAIGARGFQNDDDDDDDLGPTTSPINVGDHVLFSKYTGTKIQYMVTEEIDGRKQKRSQETVLVMREVDVLATIDDEKEAANLRVRA